MTNKKKLVFGHDHFFKKAMSRKKVASEFLETYLPNKVKKLVDLSSIEKQNSEFLSNILGKGIVDLLYKVNFEQKEGYISVLIEQQTSIDSLMVFRIQQYMLRLCEEHIRKSGKKFNKKNKLPLIYPLILYTGRQKYTAPRSFYDLFEDKELAKEFITQDTQVIDLNKIKDIKLRKRYHSGIMLYLMKHIYEKEFLPYLKEVRAILEILSTEDFKYIKDMVYYVIGQADSDKKEEILKNFKEVIPDNKRGEVVTIAEQLIQEGKLVGMQEGKIEVARKLLSKNLDEQLIVESTGLSIAEIRKLKLESHSC